MHNSEGRVRRISGKISSAPNERAIATHAPAASPAHDKDDAAMCDAEVAGRKISCGDNSNPATALATIQPNVSCEWVTPFGLPVLPEVKKMNAGASPRGGEKSADGRSVVISSSSWRCGPRSAA